MKKRWICALLAAVLLLSIVPTVSLEAKAASNMKASQELIEMLKKFEGFLQYPKWDYKQYSMGYTRGSGGTAEAACQQFLCGDQPVY